MRRDAGDVKLERFTAIGFDGSRMRPPGTKRMVKDKSIAREVILSEYVSCLLSGNVNCG